MAIERQPDSQEPHVQIRMSRRERTQPNDSILEIYRTLASPLSYPSQVFLSPARVIGQDGWCETALGISQTVETGRLAQTPRVEVVLLISSPPQYNGGGLLWHL